MKRKRRLTTRPLVAGLAVPLVMACSGSGGQDCPTDKHTGCAPPSQRVDLYVPKFANPTKVTNPLLPISTLDSVVYVGTVDHAPFRTETTLLPETTIVKYKGQKIETLTFQYMAFSDGRIQEIAIDLYAQDDLGAVFYLGEAVADYDETGVIYTHEGTWRAGVNGAPVTMNMPASLRVGDAWRAEDVAPAAWEQITVKSVHKTLDGPSGPVAGCVITDELKLDNTGEQKIFAPGYGELSTGSLATDNLEALALAVPIDALSGAVPTELYALAKGTSDLFDAAEAADWTGASAALATIKNNWETHRAGSVPPLLEAEMDRILGLLTAGVDAQNAAEARDQAIDLTRFIYDFRLRYQPSTEINRARFDVWLAQVLVDAAAGEAGPVKGDTATLELVWNRIAHTFDSGMTAAIKGQLGDLRKAADAEDVAQASAVAQQLRGTFADIGWH